MNIKNLKKKWHKYGKKDALWTILTYSDKKNNQWELEEFFQTGEKEIDGVMNYVKSLNYDLKKERALDFGCGVGRLTQALAKHFKEAVGVDIAPSMIELAQKHNKQGSKCKFMVNDTTDLKTFSDNSFDFIYTNIVLQHMKPKYAKKYIVEFLRILKPHGLLIFQQPSGKVDGHKLISKIKRLIVNIIPSSWLDKLYLWKYNELRMDVYAIKKEEIIKLLEAHQATVIDISQDEHTGSNWISLRYCVTKK